MPAYPSGESPLAADRSAAGLKPSLLLLTGLGAEADGQLEKVATLAEAWGAPLRLGYCAGPGPDFGQPLARLRQRARRLGRWLGRPVETLPTEVRSPVDLRQELADCALVCLAGTSRLRHALIEQVTRPLLLLGRRSPARYRSVLLALSLGTGSPQQLRWARALAPQALLELLHVSELPQRPSGPQRLLSPSVLDEVLRSSWAALGRRLQQLSQGLDEGVLSRSLVHGALASTVARRCAGGGHELLVLGRSPRRCWLPRLQPPLALRLVDQLQDCDLLVVPQTLAPGQPVWNGSLCP